MKVNSHAYTEGATYLESNHVVTWHQCCIPWSRQTLATTGRCCSEDRTFLWGCQHDLSQPAVAVEDASEMILRYSTP
jgi:hypothetical protein